MPTGARTGQRVGRVLYWLTPAASVIVIAVALTDFLGWFLGIEALVRVVPGAAVMTPNTALGLLLLGAGLWLLRADGAAGTRGGRVGRMLGLAAALLGLLTLGEYVFRVDLGIDRLLFPNRVPGRPSLVTAACFLLAGCALLLLDVRTRRGLWPATALAIIVAFIAIQTLTGYGFGEETLFAPEEVIVGLPSFTPMAINTAASILILALGILSARPRHGVVALVTADDAGGFTARRLLPAAVLVPLVFGWLVLAAAEAGLFGIAFGTSLLVVFTMAALTLLIGWNAAILRRVDLHRREIERALRDSEERFRLLFEEAGIGIGLADTEGRILASNPAFERFLDRPAGEILNRRFTEFTHPEDIDLDWGLFQELLTDTRRAYQIEKRYLRRDGSVVWGRLTGSLIRDAEGRPRYGIGMVEDITARKRSEEAQRRLTAIIESTPDFVGTADASSRALTVNRAGREMVGIPEEDVTSLTIPDFHPIWAARLVVAEGIPAAIRDGAWSGESAVLGPDGREIPVSQVIISHRGPTGRVEYLSTIMRDITDRKRQEESQRFLADASRALSASLDFDAVLRAVAELVVPERADICAIDLVGEPEERWRRTLAHADPAQQPLLEELRRFPPAPGDRPGVSEVLRTGRSLLVPEVSDEFMRASTMDRAHYRIVRRLGARSLIVVPLRAGGRVLGTMSLARVKPAAAYETEDLAVIESLADRAALALENARLYHQARAATRVRDEVLRVVAHDLRNPLNTISLGAGLLRERLPADVAADLRAQTEIIGRSVDRANRLIQDLLDVARLEAGRLPIQRRPLAVEVLVREAVGLQAALAQQKSLRLETRVPDGLPPVLADRDRILQVFSNLLGNAIKFTPEGGRITVRAEPVGHEVRFCVSDTGPGIRSENLPHLFEAFWQAGAAARGGAGLGLAIARGIVDAHGGRIWVRSQPGTGSTFCFTLPAAQAGAAAGERAAD